MLTTPTINMTATGANIKALMFAPVAIISIVGAAMGIKITTFLNRIIKTACVS